MQGTKFIEKTLLRFLVAMNDQYFIPVRNGDRILVCCLCFKSLVSKNGLKNKVVPLFLQHEFYLRFATLHFPDERLVKLYLVILCQWHDQLLLFRRPGFFPQFVIPVLQKFSACKTSSGFCQR